MIWCNYHKYTYYRVILNVLTWKRHLYTVGEDTDCHIFGNSVCKYNKNSKALNITLNPKSDDLKQTFNLFQISFVTRNGLTSSIYNLENKLHSAALFQIISLKSLIALKADAFFSMCQQMFCITYNWLVIISNCTFRFL